MSDRPRGVYQGRGGGSGRGGHRGDRGSGNRGRGDWGRGDRGRGDRGRGGGGYRGDSGGGDRGRGGGQFRGRGGGEFRGRGVGDRGRGGGGYRGGGDGARFDKFAGEPAAFREGSVPNPDEQITALENSALIAIHQKVKSAAEGEFPTGHPLVVRPGFATNGRETIVWTNHFDLRVTDVGMLKYAMSVEKIPKARGPEEGEAGSSKQPAKDPPKKSATAAGKSADDKVSSRKQEEVLRAVLPDLLPRGTFATELKSQIFTIQPLDLPKDNTIVHRHGPLGRQEYFRVRFDGPFSVPLTDMLRYLNQMYDPSGDVSFPKFEDPRDALSVVLGSYARMTLTTAAAGRSRFFPLDSIGEVFKIGVEGNKLLRGVFASVRPATGRLLLNVNVSHGVFRPHGPLPDVFEELNPGMDDRYWTDVSNMLHKLRVRMKVLPEPGVPKGLTHDNTAEKTIISLAITIDGCTDNPKPVIKYRGSGPANIFFWISAPAPHGFTPGQITVKQYYRTRYRYEANDELPCANVGTVQKPVFVPAELLEVIPGQLLRRKTTPNETADMIKVACRSPYANAQSLMKQGRQILKLDGNEDLARFGVSVGKELLTVKARELPPPGIVYSDGKIVNILNGGWNMRDVGVYMRGKALSNWTYVSFGLNNAFGEIDEVMRKFVDFQKRSMGIAISGQARGPESLPHGGNGIRTLRDILKKHQRNEQLPEYIFFILPKQDSFLYNQVKTVCDVEFGIHSTCMVWGNLRKSNPQFFANVALKVNLKMGGMNHYLRTEIPVLASGKTMVVGYDVTHPTNVAGDADKMPSLVGIVASVDKYLGQWPATAWSQKGKVEMLDRNLEDALKRHLKIWQARNGKYPERIIVFRDGVSEGQFQQVLDKELPFMRSACASLYPGGKGPCFSIIVSVKRHQTRFYPGDPQKITSSRNVLPGTVVDRGVTQANVWDFFLTAHSALQGTARPAHYTVLLDECFRAAAGLNAANSLEALTHEMCYLFGRATKAVSICPPAYYADILCTRQRAYMDDVFSSGGRNIGPALSENDHTSIIGRKVHEKIRDSMYYI